MSTADPKLSERARAAQRLVMDYKRTFGSDTGKRVLADLEALSRYRETVFFPVKTDEPSSDRSIYAYDPITAALTDGARSLVVRIHKALAAESIGDSDAKPKTRVKRK